MSEHETEASVGSEPPDGLHPEDYCHRCGGPNISWYTPGGVWDPVMRPDPNAPYRWNEIICPQCFVSLAGGGTWAVIPTRDDGERWTSADERESVRIHAARALNTNQDLKKARAEERAHTAERIGSAIAGRVCTEICEHPTCSTFRFAARIARQHRTAL